MSRPLVGARFAVWFRRCRTFRQLETTGFWGGPARVEKVQSDEKSAPFFIPSACQRTRSQVH